ncbi:MAG: AAA family ATPase [Candidatus Hydrogenedentales bacterium]|jgi:putative secretion ATPase (PEP-CTERM system associated)
MQVHGGGMYESFYGLREKPFNLTPDPRFLYLSEMHKEAFAHLIFGIRNRVGFIMVTGEIGTGKTTICRSLLGQLDQDVELAFIFNPCLSPEELLRKINEDFGIRSRAISVKGLIDELNTYLLDRHANNKNCVLVIDEAQNLTPPVLEQIRLLSNLETERQKLLQIVLIGQPELAEHLELAELRQLNQRITARYHLKPLGEKETLQYIAYRLRVAGGMRKVRFTRGAIKAVYRHSKGTPRVINAVCDRALLIGYAKETQEITRALVKQAAREIRGERIRAKKKGTLKRYIPTPRLMAAAALIVLVGLFIVRPVAKRLDLLVAVLQNPPASGPALAEAPAPKSPEDGEPESPGETLAETPPSAPPEPAAVEEPSAEEPAPATPELAVLEEPPAEEPAPATPEPAAVEEPPAEEPAPATPEPAVVEEPPAEEPAPATPEPAAVEEPPAEEPAPATPEPAAVMANLEEPAPLAPETPEAPAPVEADVPAPPTPPLVAAAQEAEPDTEASAAEEDPFLRKAPGVFDALALVASVVPDDPPAPKQTPLAPSSAEEVSALVEAVVSGAETPPAPASVEEASALVVVAADEGEASPVEESAAEEAPPEAAAETKAVAQSFEARLQALDPDESLKTAAASLLGAWNMALLSDLPAGREVKDLLQFAQAYGLTGEPLSAGLPELEAVNLPTFVRMSSGGKTLWVALLSTGAESVRCSMEAGETVDVPRDEFVQAYRAESVVLWRDPAPGAETLKPDMSGDQVRALQHRLRQLGRYQGELTGVYDTTTAEAVTGIQTATALKRDGKAGQQVRMVLCSWLDDIPTPELHAMDRRPAIQVASEQPPASEPEAPPAPPEPVQAQKAKPAPLPAPAPAPELDLPKTPESATTEAEKIDTEPLSEEEPAVDRDIIAVETPQDETPQLVTVMELPADAPAATPAPGRDVEALLAEEVYGQNSGEAGKEVTSPVTTGAPLVPHQGTTVKTADGENE